MGTSFFHFVTMHTFDRQTDRCTDRWTERPWQYCALHYMQSHGKNKNKTNQQKNLKNRHSHEISPRERVYGGKDLLNTHYASFQPQVKQ